MDKPPVKPTLKALNCDGCGAAVPLGEGATAACLRCGAAVTLPAEYIQLRDAERAKHAADAAAQSLYHTLGTPPGRFAQWWAGVPLGWIYFLVWPLVFVSVGLMVAILLNRLTPVLGGKPADVLSQTQYLGLVALAMFLLLGLPLALAIYGHRRTNARRTLQAGLAALPPPREGGPAQCRACGGGLTVKSNALGAACDYCGADNLLAVPESWIEKLRGGAAQLGRTAQEALSEDQRMRSETRRRLLCQVGLLGFLIFAPLLLFGRLFDSDKKNAWPPPLREAVATESRFGLLDPKGEKRMSDVAYGPAEIPLGPRFVGSQTWRFSYDAAECQTVKDKVLCERFYLVPLQKGETLRVTLPGQPANVTLLRAFFRQRGNGIFGDDWQTLGGGKNLKTTEQAEFTAPYNGWFQLELDSIEVDPKQKPPAVFTVGTEIRPAGK